MSNIYTEHGFRGKGHYAADLRELSADYGVDEQTVFGLASVLGISECHDGLVSHLEDIAQNCCAS